MSRLSLYLLGPPRATYDGEPIDVNTSKGIALLAYLAINRGQQRRDALVNLLWPESDRMRGRTNLRSTLYALRRALAGDWLDADRESIGLAADVDAPALLEPGLEVDPAKATERTLWLDIDQFHAQLAACHRHEHPPTEVCPDCLPSLVAAVDLYRGDFMSGFTLKDSFNFDDWQFFQAESLRREFSAALDRLVRCYIAQGAFEPAIRYARKWLALDRLNESVHRQLMRLYAWSGQPSTSLRQYEECVRVLESQLGIDPQEATTDLYRAIAAGQVPEPPLRGPAQTLKPSPGTRVGPVRAVFSEDTWQLPAEPAPTPPSETKRMVAVLSADISRSFSEQRETSAEDRALSTVRFHSALQEILSRYEGKTERMVGSSVLVLFGMTQTRESDPELAVRAAMEARQAARDLGLVLTAGVTTGEIYAGAAGQERARALVGSAIDRAIHLAAQAQAGQILAGEMTYRLTYRAFEWRPFSSDSAGADTPATVYQVGRPLFQPQKARGIEGMRAELTGRDEELFKLKHALELALGGHGQIVSLVGEAGVGKSRLVAELQRVTPHDKAVELNPLWLEGRCLDLGTAPSYAPFIDILRALWGWSAREADRRRYERITLFLEGMVEQGYLDRERAGEVAALLGHLLALPVGPEWEARLESRDAGQIRERTFLAIRDLFYALCHKQPVVLVFEDLHWADSLSLDLLSLLMEHIDAVALLLLCVYRPVHEHRSWHLATVAAQKCREQYTEIHVRELTRDQSRQMVSSLLVSQSLSPPVKDRILGWSQGNPFFIEEVVRSSIDAGALYQEEGVWHARQEIASLTMPRSIQSVTLSRVDRLSEHLQHILKAASVIGRVFRLRVLAHTLEQEPELENALWELEDQALIYRERMVPEIEYSFKHVLTQETVYQSIVSDRRARFHRKVAQAIEFLYRENLDEYYEQLAHHSEEGGDVKQAIAYLYKAGEKAKRSYANAEAIAHLSRGLALLGTLPETAERDRQELELLLALGVPLVFTRGHGTPEVESIYARARVLCAQGCDPVDHFQVVLGLRRVHLMRGDVETALKLGRELFDIAGVVDDPIHLARAHMMQGETLYQLGAFDAALEHCTKGLAVQSNDPLQQRADRFRFGNDTRVGCGMYAAMARWHLGYPDQAEAGVRKTLDLAESLDHPFTTVLALRFAAQLYLRFQDASQTLVHANPLIQLAREQGFALFEAEARGIRGWALAAQGQTEAGLAALQEGISALQRIGARFALRYAQAWQAEALGKAGQAEEGLRTVEQALSLKVTGGKQHWQADMHRLKGELLLMSCGREDEAEACFRHALQLAREQSARSWELRAATSLGRLLHRRGRTKEARALVEGIYGWFSEGFDTADLREARALFEQWAD